MSLQPPLLVPSGDAENGERIIECISEHLGRLKKPSPQFCRDIHRAASNKGHIDSGKVSIPVPNCCVIPSIDEVILDLERMVTLRDEIVYRFAETGANEDDAEGEAEAEVIALLREYCALLGALTTVPGLGFGIFGNARGDCTGERARDLQISGLFLTWHKLRDDNDGKDMNATDDNDAMEIDDTGEQHFSVSSLYAERQLSAYLLAALEYQSAVAKMSVFSSPSSPTDMGRARDALKSAQLGFGRAAALFDHVRTIIEHDMLEKHEQNEADGSSSIYVDNETKISSSASELAAASSSSVPMLPISPHQLLDPSALHVLHLASVASGQACYYYHASVLKNRVQSALAKLAAGAALMFEAVASFARQMAEDETIENNTTRRVRSIRSYMPSKALLRSTYAAGENYYLALSDYHEACVKKSRSERADEIGRLRSAACFIDNATTEMLGNHKHDLMMTANGLVANQDTAGAHLTIRLQSLLCAQVINLNTEISNLLLKAEEEWTGGDVPTDLLPVRPQTVMKLAAIPTEANFLEPSLGIVALVTNPPLQRLLNRTGVESCHRFHQKLAQMLISTRKTAHNATESAGEQLAKLGLPECITTFKATVEAAKTARGRNICGIPPAMADQLESLHSSQGVMLLSENLFMLEEVAALARQTLDKTEEMLDDTVQADNEFRRDHPTFTGRDVAVEHSQIAVTSLDGNGATETDARRICAKIRGWLNQANDGDQKVRVVLEEIETDPKYRLVMLPLEQLEKLIRGGSGGLTDDTNDDEEERTTSSSSTGADGVDTLALLKQLEHLKTLMASRERILEEMEKDVLVFNQRERAVQAIARRGDISPDEQFYQALTDVALPLFDHHFDKIKTSIEKQQRLFRIIVQLYSKFIADKTAYEQMKEATEKDLTYDAASSPAKAYLQKIASALKTIEWIRPQLVQGRNFYQTVLANIEELKKKVEDTNAVLASERIFFEDSHHSRQEEEHRRRQEEEDERLAQELMREAEEEAAQQPPQTPADPRQQEEDERLARELARQFQDEANISTNNGTTNLAGNRDESMGEPNDLAQGRNNLNNDVNAFDLTEDTDRRGRNLNGRHRRSSSFDQVTDNAHLVPPLEAPRRHSSLVDLGDIPREIFAPIPPRGHSSGSNGRMSQISLGGVSSLGSASIVRSFHRQQQQQQREEIPPGDQEQEVAIGGDQSGDNLTGIPRRPSVPDDRAEQQAVVPEPRSPFRGPRRSTHTSGGISRSGLPGRSSRPGIVNVRNDEMPEFEVNDEAFAQLVAMDFPPDMVRDALARFDNIERATEYILSNI